MNIINKNGTITVKTDNRIDAASAPELIESFRNIEFKSLVLDLEDTQYVSSAALRAFMIGKQKANEQNAEISLININPTVREVLDLSGFSKILKLD